MKKVKDFISNICDNEKLVIAVSGGMDSILLLHLLIEVKNVKNLIVAHVNHNKREESNEEALFVEKLCNDNNIVFEYKIIEEYNSGNFHDVARKIRYDFFKDIMKKHNSKILLTAHHGDDLIETIMMRIVRGSNLKGYSGFREMDRFSDYTLYRPLIFVSKDEIKNYVISNKIEYREDSSNFKDIYTRNRFRSNVLPFLKQEDEEVCDKFYNFSKNIYDNYLFINKITNNYLDVCYKNSCLDLSLFCEYDEVIKDNILNNILSLIYKDSINLINSKHIILIKEFLDINSGYLDLPKGIKLCKSYNKLFFNIISDEGYQFELNKEFKYLNYEINFINKTELNGNDICRINYDDVTLPLIVRSKQDGDRISLKGLNGSKKVSDIFVEKKINLLERNSYPIVCDSAGKLIWIPGLKKSKICRENSEKYDIIFKYNYKEENNEYKRY